MPRLLQTVLLLGRIEPLLVDCVHVKALFVELGFDRDQVEMRAVLFVVYHSWERTMFEAMSDRKRESLRKLRLELLTR